MKKNTDVKIKEIKLYFLPVTTRVPLKFGTETLTYVTCARTSVVVENGNGKVAEGWGETPLSVQWAWPSNITYEERHKAMKDFCVYIVKKLVSFNLSGHPIEICNQFTEDRLITLLEEFNKSYKLNEQMPYLASLICFSLFDIAIHDAYGIVNNIPVYETYNKKFMNADLSYFLTSDENSKISFKGLYPCNFLLKDRREEMFAWHLVGGKDPIKVSELKGDEPDDGYPILLEHWIKKDGLKCLKVKLRGNDSDWDYKRLVDVGKIALENDVFWLTTDFNCTVNDPSYVNEILGMLIIEYPKIYASILYVEQPFPYELEGNQIDVHSVSSRKPLFMDESAHNWKLVKLGRKLGWTGVALKTCKTQTGAILSLCFAKAHGMTLMVQDLTNPMLAQIPHVLLASYAGTIMGVETNSMQFYPEASKIEEKIHPGIFKRKDGKINIRTIKGPGFGYQIDKINRKLSAPVINL